MSSFPEHLFQMRCARCGTVHNLASQLTPGEAAPPQPDEAILVCARCLALCMYVGPEGECRIITDDEWIELPVETRTMLKRTLDALAEAKAAKPSQEQK